MPLPGLLAFASLSLGTRSVPIIASVVLHAGIAAGLVATATAGHARPALAAPSAEMTVDVESATTVPVTPPETEAAPVPAPPTHTHDYPVDPSHDARPHDPAMHHDHDEHASEPAPPPAPAAPALVSDAPDPPSAALPRFDLSTGSGVPMGARVAAQGTSATSPGATTGNGTSATAPAPNDDVVHAASAVQVSARLVSSVTAAYPVHARSDEVEGDVGVEIVVDREGHVVEARVTRPAGHGFDDAALAAVRAYRFSPAQREGRAVRVRMPWSVQFRLR